MESSAPGAVVDCSETGEWYEDEIQLLAFENWKYASSPESDIEEDWAEVEARCHASCL